jgi:mannose-1-phosphate guanylyltransferase
VALTLLVHHRLDTQVLLLQTLGTVEVLQVLLAAQAITTTVQIALEAAVTAILIITQEQTLQVIQLQLEAQAQAIQTEEAILQVVVEDQAVALVAAVLREARDNLSKLL